MNEKKTDMKKVIRNKSGRFAMLPVSDYRSICQPVSFLLDDCVFYQFKPGYSAKKTDFWHLLCREFQKSCEQRYHCPRFLEFPDYFGLRMLINAHRMLYGWVWLCQV